MKIITIDKDNDGVRLDRILRKQLKSIPLSLIYQKIRRGIIRVNRKRTKQNYRVKEGDSIQINTLAIDSGNMDTFKLKKIDSLFKTAFFKNNFQIIFEDENLLVCNKPAGLVVHSGTGHNTQKTLIDLATGYLRNSFKKKTAEPILVHRLDKDTSGIILIAKNRQILRTLHANIRTHSIEKKYTAICHGTPLKSKGIIDVSLKRTHFKNSGTKMTVSTQGKKALSSYRVIAIKNNLSQIEIDLHTGKTHQIRVHLSHIGCPIIGDKRYGNSELDIELFRTDSWQQRLYLHADQISFFYQEMNKKVTFSAPAPAGFTLS
ncbi:MAG: RluA family pseudouridine synthase [Chitinispirillia bacterium]|jgi:RluA family pseudouridine synthase